MCFGEGAVASVDRLTGIAEGGNGRGAGATSCLRSHLLHLSENTLVRVQAGEGEPS